MASEGRLIRLTENISKTFAQQLFVAKRQKPRYILTAEINYVTVLVYSQHEALWLNTSRYVYRLLLTIFKVYNIPVNDIPDLHAI